MAKASANGINNVATSGIKIYTTVDKQLQEKSFLALRKELSRLSVRLDGYEHEKVREFYNNLGRAGDWDLREGGFLMGRIAAVNTADQPTITVSLGNLDGRQNLTGTIDSTSIMSVVDSLVKWEKQRWTEPKTGDLHRFLEGMKVGDPIFVSVRSIDNIDNTILLDLEKYPEIQGGVIILKDGTIKAMVGGMENHFFNRAVAAKRAMGSVIKPLVYTAALQLGWNSTDPLDNERNLFVYQRQAYFPRPDHDSPHKRVSMSWAGVHSENVATVWLLYHLCDRLTTARFKELITHLDLGPREYESHAGYRQRLRDSLGIMVDREQLHRAAFRQAVINLEPDLIFNNRLDEIEYLKKMQYGADFEMFLEDVENLQGPGYETSERRRLKAEKEKKIRQKILENNYLRQVNLLDEVEYLRRVISDQQGIAGDPDRIFAGAFYHDRLNDRIIYAAKPDEEGFWQLLGPDDIRRRLNPFSLARFRKNFQDEFWDAVLIEGRVSAATMRTLRNTVQDQYDHLASLPPYSFEVLSQLPDFRVLAGLRYVTALGRALNIRSRLEPVLSFPLGSNVISLYEAAMAYQAITTGLVAAAPVDEGRDELAIIDRIENADGETIYVPDRAAKRVVDIRTNLVISDILRNIVKFGTGRYASRNVRLHSYDPEIEQQLRQFEMPVPVMGKTGTANNFTNSAFAGIVPGPHEEKGGFTVEDGYTVTAYTGYDDNIPMVRHSTHITGAGGALPVWTRIANDILLEKNFGARLDFVDLAFSVDPVTGETGLHLIRPDLGQKIVPVNPDNGMLPPKPGNTTPAADSKATTLTFGEFLPTGELEPARIFKPYWNN